MLPGSIVNGIFRAAGFVGVGSDQERRMIDHPFVADLKATAMVPRTDHLNKISGSQHCVVAAFPAFIP